MLPVHAVCVVLLATIFAGRGYTTSVHLAAERRSTFQLPRQISTSPVKIESTVLEDGDVQGFEDGEGEHGDPEVDLYCGENCEDPGSYRNITVKETEESLAFETVFSNGTRTLTRLHVQDKMVDYINAWTRGVRAREREAKGSVRRKRAVFEFDTRFEVNVAKYLALYPFSAAVKLSIGCSGVLIAPQHVLTAAHCLHNGRRYTVKIKDIRAGFRREQEATPGEDPNAGTYERSFIWIRADKAYLPYDWTNKKNGGLQPLDKDYAVVLLKRSPDREPLEVGMGDPATIPTGTMVHFSSFDIADEPKLFYRFCTVTGGTQELFYQQCDGEPPSIGAGVYVRQWDPETGGWSRKVIGLFGGFASFVNAAGVREEQNVAMRITPLKFAQICYWVTGDYGECKG